MSKERQPGAADCCSCIVVESRAAKRNGRVGPESSAGQEGEELSEVVGTEAQNIDYLLLWHCKNKNFAVAEQLLSTRRKLRRLEESRSRGRTAAHFAAMDPTGEAVLDKLLKLCGYDCLLQEDIDKATPLHFAARYHEYDTVKGYLKALSNRFLHNKKDTEGNTVAHWATRNQVEGDMIFAMMDIFGISCLNWANNRGETVLHHVFQWCRLDKVEKFIDKCMCVAGRRTPFRYFILPTKDNDLNGAFHFAARNEHDYLWLTLLVEKFGLKQLQNMNSNDQTPLHVFMRHCSSQALSGLFGKLPIGDSQKNEIELRWLTRTPDRAGNTCLHVAAKWGSGGVFDQLLEKILAAAEEKYVRGCLGLKNKTNSTVLHYAFENCSKETAQKLISIASTDLQLLTDGVGNTCLHIIAKRSDKAEQLPKALEATECDENHCLRLRNKKQQSVLHLGIDALTDEQIKGAKGDIKHKDKAGNTLLHFLLQSSQYCSHADDASSEAQHDSLNGDLAEEDSETAAQILSRMKLLIDNGVDPSAENNLGQNCLHATQLRDCVLGNLLEKCAQETENIFKKLLHSTAGQHAIHAFAGRYRLETVTEPLAKLSELDLPDLLKIEVSKNTNRGATCLHFACAAGHEVNIEYLLNKGLKLSSVTHSGQSCVDFAVEKGNLEILSHIVADYGKTRSKNNTKRHQQDGEDIQQNEKQDMIKLWRLVDPPYRALIIPDRATAGRLIVSIADETQRAKLSKSADHATTSQSVAKVSKKRTDREILLRAVEMDSPQIYRSALSLQIVTANTERAFPNVLKDSLQPSSRESDKSGHGKLYHLRQSFQNHKAFLHRRQMDVQCEMALIDSVAFFDRDEILPDLILTRQFELIPCCISLLIELGPKVLELRTSATGKHEQLEQLQSKVTSIVVNALNELFVNANDRERQLLFSYIRGEIRDSDNENPGPKFPYRTIVYGSEADRVKHKSVLEMVQLTDNYDLFATDFMYSLADEVWNKGCSHCMLPESLKRSQGCAPAMRFAPTACSCFRSPRAKFWTHTTSFLLFLGYFAWYIIDFQGSFWLHGMEAILVAYSLCFFLQEGVEFWATKALKRYSVGRELRWCPEYFASVLNVLDILALFFLLIGMVWRWALVAQKAEFSTALYPCQMVLSVSFALFCFRAVSFLSFSRFFGPMLAMLWSLLVNDLLPFLAILAVIFCSFGVFFFNLLFSTTGSPEAHITNKFHRWDTFKQALTLPFNLLFTNFDEIQFNGIASNYTMLGNRTRVAYTDGFDWFNNLFLFVFMGLVNIVMLNLLIALFNLRVSRMAGESIGIWRKQKFDMLEEYKRLSPIPPPFSFIWYICHYFPEQIRKQRRRAARSIGPQQDPWWLDESKYPKDYVKFLKFQAVQFRRARPRLLRDIRWNRNDFDVLKAHTRNQLSDVNGQIHESMAAVKERLDSTEDSSRHVDKRSKKSRRRMKRLGKEVAEMRKETGEILRLLRNQTP